MPMTLVEQTKEEITAGTDGLNIQTEEGKDLSTILTMEPNDVRQLIKDNITDSGQRDHVFYMVGLFLLNKPDIAKKLIDLIKADNEDNSIEEFGYLVYGNIEDILIKKRDAIEHEIGPMENPGKKQISAVLENIQQHRKPDFQKEVAAGTLSRLSVPGFPVGLLPKGWISPVK